MRKNFIIIIGLIFLLAFSANAKTKKKYELKKLQFGFGGTIATGNLLGLIENVRMMSSLSAGDEYSYPGMSDEQSAALEDMAVSMRRAIMVANILGSMEYGLQFRILKHAFIFHSDLIFLPFEGSYNGKIDLLLSVNAGIRAPFFIMPYITAGLNFSFSFYPDKVVYVDTWKKDAGYGVVENFVWRPGMNTIVGLDIKFKKFSFGVYYKYTIKDFNEFGHWFGALVNDLEESTSAARERAAGMVFGSQSRFGITFTRYLVRKKRKKNNDKDDDDDEDDEEEEEDEDE